METTRFKIQVKDCFGRSVPLGGVVGRVEDSYALPPRFQHATWFVVLSESKDNGPGLGISVTNGIQDYAPQVYTYIAESMTDVPEPHHIAWIEHYAGDGHLHYRGDDPDTFDFVSLRWVRRDNGTHLAGAPEWLHMSQHKFIQATGIEMSLWPRV